jgi:hypothetical protein
MYAEVRKCLGAGTELIVRTQRRKQRAQRQRIAQGLAALGLTNAGAWISSPNGWQMGAGSAC